jgi:hypothetical protein
MRILSSVKSILGSKRSWLQGELLQCQPGPGRRNSEERRAHNARGQHCHAADLCGPSKRKLPGPGKNRGIVLPGNGFRLTEMESLIYQHSDCLWPASPCHCSKNHQDRLPT